MCVCIFNIRSSYIKCSHYSCIKMWLSWSWYCVQWLSKTLALPGHSGRFASTTAGGCLVEKRDAAPPASRALCEPGSSLLILKVKMGIGSGLQAALLGHCFWPGGQATFPPGNQDVFGPGLRLVLCFPWAPVARAGLEATLVPVAPLHKGNSVTPMAGGLASERVRWPPCPGPRSQPEDTGLPTQDQPRPPSSLSPCRRVCSVWEVLEKYSSSLKGKSYALIKTTAKFLKCHR